MVLGTWLCPLEHAETRLSPNIIHFLLETRVCSEAHTLGPPDEVWEPWKCLHEAHRLKTLLRWYSGPLCVLARSEGTSDKDNTALKNKIPVSCHPLLTGSRDFFFSVQSGNKVHFVNPSPALREMFIAHCWLLG